MAVIVGIGSTQIDGIAPDVKALASSPGLQIESFGASPSASAAKNYAAIQAALDVGGLLWLTTPGTYQISGELQIGSNTDLRLAPGVTIQCAADFINILSTKALHVADTPVTLSWSSGISVSVTWPNHGLALGDAVVVAGANQSYFNGCFLVETVTDVNTFTYFTVRLPATAPTGSPVARKANVNIKISGGTWDRNYPTHTGSETTGAGLMIGYLYNGTFSETLVINYFHYGYNSGALRDVRFINTTYNTNQGDGIKVYGPAFGVKISGIYGRTRDDAISFQTREFDIFAAYRWTFGDIVGCSADDIYGDFGQGSGAIAACYISTNEVMDEVHYSNLYGSAIGANSKVFYLTDQGDSLGVGNFISVSKVRGFSTISNIVLGTGAVKKLELSDLVMVPPPSPSFGVNDALISIAAVAVSEMTVSGFLIPNSASWTGNIFLVEIGSVSSVDILRVRSPLVLSTSPFSLAFLTAGTTVKQMDFYDVDVYCGTEEVVTIQDSVLGPPKLTFFGGRIPLADSLVYTKSNCSVNMFSLVMSNMTTGVLINGLSPTVNAVMAGSRLDAGVWINSSNAAVYNLSRLDATTQILFEGSGTFNTNHVALTGNTTFYVRSDGVDASGNGRTDAAGSAYLTFQYAYNDIAKIYDFADSIVTIQAGNEGVAKTFAGITFGTSWVGGGSIIVKGQGAASTTINDQGSFGDAFTNTIVLPGPVQFQNLKMTTAVGGCIHNVGVGLMRLGLVQNSAQSSGLEFGAAGSTHMTAKGSGSVIDTNAAYTVSGGAVFHMQSSNDGYIGDSYTSGASNTTTISGAPAFSASFVDAEAGGIIDIERTTYSGAGATGSRFTVKNQGIMLTGSSSLTYFPGNSAGALLPGIYNANDDVHGVYQVLGNKAVTGNQGTWGLNTEFNEIIWNGGARGWTSASGINSDGSSTFETGWFRDTSYQIGQRNGANANSYYCYNTFTSSTSYERAAFDWTTTANVLTIGTQKGSGGGSTRNIQFVAGGSAIGDYGITAAGQWAFGTALRVGGDIVTTSANIYVGLTVSAPLQIGTWSLGVLQWNADGVIQLCNGANNNFGRLQFGGSSNSFPSLKRSSATIAFRLADDTADAGITAAGGTFSGSLVNTGITADTGHTDSTVCQDTTSHQFYSGTGAAGICLGTSSVRFKHDVMTLDAGLSHILALQPVSYRLNVEKGGVGKKLYGFTAEQGGEAIPDLMEPDAEGQPQRFDYMGVVPVLVNAIKEQQIMIDELQRRLDAIS